MGHIPSCPIIFAPLVEEIKLVMKAGKLKRSINGATVYLDGSWKLLASAQSFVFCSKID